MAGRPLSSPHPHHEKRTTQADAAISVPIEATPTIALLPRNNNRVYYSAQSRDRKCREEHVMTSSKSALVAAIIGTAVLVVGVVLIFAFM